MTELPPAQMRIREDMYTAKGAALPRGLEGGPGRERRGPAWPQHPGTGPGGRSGISSAGGFFRDFLGRPPRKNFASGEKNPDGWPLPRNRKQVADGPALRGFNWGGGGTCSSSDLQLLQATAWRLRNLRGHQQRRGTRHVRTNYWRFLRIAAAQPGKKNWGRRLFFSGPRPRTFRKIKRTCVIELGAKRESRRVGQRHRAAAEWDAR